MPWVACMVLSTATFRWHAREIRSVVSVFSSGREELTVLAVEMALDYAVVLLYVNDVEPRASRPPYETVRAVLQ